MLHRLGYSAVGEHRRRSNSIDFRGAVDCKKSLDDKGSTRLTKSDCRDCQSESSKWKLYGVWQQSGEKPTFVYMYRQYNREQRDNVQFFLVTHYGKADWWYDIPIFTYGLKVDKFDFKASVKSIGSSVYSVGGKQAQSVKDRETKQESKIDNLEGKIKDLERKLEELK